MAVQVIRENMIVCEEVCLKIPGDSMAVALHVTPSMRDAVSKILEDAGLAVDEQTSCAMHYTTERDFETMTSWAHVRVVGR